MWVVGSYPKFHYSRLINFHSLQDRRIHDRFSVRVDSCPERSGHSSMDRARAVTHVVPRKDKEIWLTVLYSTTSASMVAVLRRESGTPYHLNT